MTMEELADRCEAAKSHRQLKFALYANEGWVICDDQATIRLLCDLYNMRGEIAAAIRSLPAPVSPTPEISPDTSRN